MANPYPSPVIYTYRVRRVYPATGNAVPLSNQTGYSVAEYSTDSGVTWAPAFSTPFQSAQEALQAISILVNNEAQFALNLAAGMGPKVVTVAYPQGV